MRSIQVLAQIKLNPTSVEHFLSVACSLADERPEVRDKIYAAAQEARSAALMIDHLRNLFSHQYGIEVEQEAGFLYGPPPPPRLAQNLERGHLIVAPDKRRLETLRSSNDLKAQFFTYSNQQNLFKASKSLAANIAKILYLTDTIDAHQAAHETRPSDLLSTPAGGSELECLISSDRFDNVANYCQLLRSFGELSTELVDLGYCILWASQERRMQLAGHTQLAPEWAEFDHAEGCTSLNFQRKATALKKQDLNENFSHHSSYSSGKAQQHNSLDPLTFELKIRQQQQQQQRRADNELESTEQSFVALATSGPTNVELSNSWIHSAELEQEKKHQHNRLESELVFSNKIFDALLEGQIQDMRNLFQVNSASKCCIRRGAECLRGLEARRSIVAQIRASISIIMAIVKSTIFGRANLNPTPVSPVLRSSQTNAPMPWLSCLQLMSDPQCSAWLSEGLAAGPKLAGCSQRNWTQTANDDKGCISTIGQCRALDITNRLASQAHSPYYNEPGNCALGLAESSARLLYQASLDRSMFNNDREPPIDMLSIVDGCPILRHFNGQHQQQQQRRRRLDNSNVQDIAPTNNHPTKGDSNNCEPNLYDSYATLSRIHRFNRTLKWNMKIMNFFLLTCNGNLSAYDAIDRLQLLVEPFGRVSSQRELTNALNESFEIHRWLNERAIGKPQANCSMMSSQANQQAVNHSTGPQKQRTQQKVILERRADDNSSPSNLTGTRRRLMAGPSSFGPIDIVDNYEDQDDNYNYNYNYNDDNNNNIDDNNFEACCKVDFACGENKENVDSNLGFRPHLAARQLAPPREIPESCLSGWQLDDNAALMNKRQLIDALTATFLGELKTDLIERVHEFTDCAYTKHEHREAIIQLVQCFKLQLNKLIKLLYKTKRKPATVSELSLNQLRHLACQIDETCAELKIELQSVVIELSDQLDRCNSDLDLVKLIKQQALVGDVEKANQVYERFHEQAEQLVELCKMLNQVASTNKMKTTTKTLAIWFELNLPQLLAVARTLSENPRSKVLKDCLWSYLQVWCSFYDDFCQLSRHIAYLTHSQYDPARAARIGSMRDRLRLRQEQQMVANFVRFEHSTGPHFAHNLTHGSSTMSMCEPDTCSANYPPLEAQPLYPAADPTSDSPRSLDHYYGFGSNYHQIVGRAGCRAEPMNSFDGSPVLTERREAMSLSPNWPHSSVSVSQQTGAHLAGLPMLHEFEYLGPGGHHEPQATPTFGLGRLGQPAMNAGAKQTSFAQLQASSPLELGNHAYRTQHPQTKPPMYPKMSQISPVQPRTVTIESGSPTVLNESELLQPATPNQRSQRTRERPRSANRRARSEIMPTSAIGSSCDDDEDDDEQTADEETQSASASVAEAEAKGAAAANEQERWADTEADSIVRVASDTAQMALSMYQFTKGEGDLNTTQDLFTQAELFAEEANELYKEARCFSYKVPSGDLKRDLLSQLSSIPALVQQLQFIVKSPTVGKAATFTKVDGVIRETRLLMEAVNRVVNATLVCRQHYNMSAATNRKRTRTLSPSYRMDRGSFDLESPHFSARQSSSIGGRHLGPGGGGMGSEPDICQYGRGPSRRAVARSSAASSKTRVSFLLF